MANEKLPEFEQSVPLASPQISQVGDTLDKLALSPDAMGTLGAQIAQTASNALSEKRGYEMGQNPHGDMLPPITETDKAFMNAYLTQANSTLSIQAQDLMSNAQDEMAKAGTTTPELIQKFHENTTAGMMGIAQQAPTPLRQQLENQFQSQIARTTNLLTSKMIGQQKKHSAEVAVAAISTHMTQMIDANLGGQPKVAQQIFDIINHDLVQMDASENITPKQFGAAKEAALDAFYTSKYTSEAIVADSHGGFEKYMQDFATGEQGLTPTRKQTVGKGIVSYFANIDALKSKNNNLVVSNLHVLESKYGTIPMSALLAAQAALPRAMFNDFMYKYMVRENIRRAAAQQLQDDIKNVHNAEKFSLLSTDRKNKALGALAKHAGGDPFEAKTAVALAAAGAWPAYVDSINAMAMSPNPDEIEKAAAVKQQFEDAHVGNNLNLSRDARDMLIEYSQNKGLGKPVVQAAAEAKQVVLETSQQQRELNADMWREELKTNYKEEYQKESLVKEVTGVGSPLLSYFGFGFSAKIPNLTAVTDTVLRTYASNFKRFRGNRASALTATKEDFKRTWGVTTLNGKKEYVYLPLEKVAQAGPDINGILQSQIINQLSFGVSQTQQAQRAGHYLFHYKLQERDSADVIIAEKLQMRDDEKELDRLHGIRSRKGNFATAGLMSQEQKLIKKVGDARKKIAAWMKGGPIQLQQIYEDGTIHNYEIKVVPHQLTGTTGQNNDEILGGFSYQMTDENGANTTLDAITGGNNRNLTFNLNKTQAQRNAAELKGWEYEDPMQVAAQDVEEGSLAQIARKALEGTVFEKPLANISITTKVWTEKDLGFADPHIDATKQLELGNIDVSKQPQVHVPGSKRGSISTVYSMGIEADGKHYLITRIGPNGEIFTPEEAVDYWRKTGKNLGVFATAEASKAFAIKLHKSEEAKLQNKKKKKLQVAQAKKEEKAKTSTPIEDSFRPFKVLSAERSQPTEPGSSPGRAKKGEVLQAPPSTNITKEQDDFLETLSRIESRGLFMTARSPKGAIGTYQFTKKTWNGLVKTYGKETGITEKDIYDAKSQEIFARILLKNNIRQLTINLGRKPYQYEMYMAHNIGATGASLLIKAAKETPSKKVSRAMIHSEPSNNPRFLIASNGKPNDAKAAVEMYKTVFRGKR